MNTIVEYKLIITANGIAFQAEVNKFLQNGRTLYGHPFSRPHGENTSQFCQALVKYEHNKA